MESSVSTILKSHIRTVPNWPEQGVMFRDISTLLLNSEAFALAVDSLSAYIKDLNCDKIAALDARGFIFGAAVAYDSQIPLVLVRKQGKLPAQCQAQPYQLEYAEACIEIHEDAISENDKVVIIDDLIATGGTALATTQLIQAMGGVVEEFLAVIGLPALEGIAKLEAKGLNVQTLCDFEGA